MLRRYPDEIIEIIYEYDGRYKIAKKNNVKDLEDSIKWWYYIKNHNFEVYNVNGLYMSNEDRKYYREKIEESFSKFYFDRYNKVKKI